MSRWGEIWIECDRHKCHSVEEYDAERLASVQSINVDLILKGWTVNADGKDICPMCAEEGKA